MNFIEDDDTDARQFRISEQASGEQAISYDFDFGVATDLSVHARRQANMLAELFSKSARHPGRRHTSCDPTRFEHHDPARKGVKPLQKTCEGQRNTRRLAGPRRRAEDQSLAIAQGRGNLREQGINWQIAHKNSHVLSDALCQSPVFN